MLRISPIEFLEAAAEMLNVQQPQMVQRIIKRALETRSGAAAE